MLDRLGTTALRSAAMSMMALVLAAASPCGAVAQPRDVGIGRSPSAYAYGGVGVLGHVRVESAPGLPALIELSSTGRAGIDFPLSRRFALGAELRGSIIRGFPGVEAYIGDVSVVPRWRLPLAFGRVTLDIAGLLGPSAAMLWVAPGADLSGATIEGHGRMGFHGGTVFGIVTRIAEKLSFGVHVGYVHQVLFAPPSDEAVFTREHQRVLQVDQVFLDTALVFDL